MKRSSWSITWSVWRALILREALHRLFNRRGAWIWLFVEPMANVAFMMFVFGALRVRHIGGLDTTVWVMVSMLGFFTFRRTMTLCMGSVGMAKPLFSYRQVKPVDTVLTRAFTEGVLMVLVSIVFLAIAAIFDLPVWADDWLLVITGMFGLWLTGFGLGLVVSVPRELVAEIGDVVNLIMTPLYLLSGVIFPLTAVPQPYQDWLFRLNPIAHGLELIRVGFGSHYAVYAGTDARYPYEFSLVCILIGLALHRIYQVKLIQK